MRNRLIAAVGAAVLAVSLAAPAASGDIVRARDERGDVPRLDITRSKLNNGDFRLVGSVRLAKRSMRPRGYVLVWLTYRKPLVHYGLELSWTKRNRLRSTVVRIGPRGHQTVTGRCDVRAARHFHRFRIGVAQDSCLRRDAGPVRFSVLATPDRGPQDTLSRQNRPIPRG